MKIQPMGNAMLKKSVVVMIAAGMFVSAHAQNPLTEEVRAQEKLQERWDRLLARTGLEFGMVAEGEFFQSTVDGSLSDPDRETADKKQSTMLDLRIGARKWDALQGDVVIRFQQDWQTYFSNRSRPIHLRWAQIGGKIGTSLNYAVGDFREKWSPLTLWAPELDLLMEAPIFAQARQEAMEEAFVGNNDRVLQGAKFNAALPFGDLVEWRLDGYASRIRRAEYLDAVGHLRWDPVSGDYIKNEIHTLDASKHIIDIVAKHGSEFGIASDLEQWSLGGNTEFLIMKNAFIGGSYLWTFEDPQTWRPNDNPLRADSGYSLNGTNWYFDNAWATDNKVISARVGADLAGFLGLKNLTAQFTAEYAMSGLSFDWLPPASSTTDATLLHADKQAVTDLQKTFRVDPASLVYEYESHTGVGAFSDTLWTVHYRMDGITPLDPIDGNALYGDLDLGWKMEDEGFAFQIGARYIDVDSSYYNLMAQSPTFRGERIMNIENDLSVAGVGAPLYSTFDAMYHHRPKVSPLRNQPYQQAPYMQNSYTHAIGTSSFTPDSHLQLLLPFGYATPNRTGIDMDASASLSDKAKIEGVYSHLKEKEIEAGMGALTRFNKAGGGVMVDIGAIAGLSRPLQLSGGYQLTTVQMNTGLPAEETFSSEMLNAGLRWDFYNKLSLLGGYQRINGSYDASPDTETQQQWRAGLQYTMRDGSYILWSVGQILGEQELDLGSGLVKDDFSQFLTQVKIRAAF